jgi:hypothetical protein
VTQLHNPEDLLDQMEDTKAFDFEVTRRCMGCGTVKTLSFFGRLPLESWIQIFNMEKESDFFCQDCGANASNSSPD